MARLRTYADAINALNTLQTSHLLKNPVRARADVLAALPRANIAPSALDRLNVVHVAGTKGKGTTCAMVSSILRHAAPSARVGLHTSPHLVAVRERIRIDGQPVSEAQFAASFFAVWDALEGACAREGLAFDGTVSRLHLERPGLRPGYARFLTLVAFDLFVRQGVDVAVLETGIGGESDATNVVDKPAAVGITSLGMDHMDLLGDTIQEIAWQKAGIMKTGCPAFTVEQEYGETVEVLESRAREKGVLLETAVMDPRLTGVALQPDAEFQRKNASLAVRLAETVLPRLTEYRPGPTLPPAFVRGLEQVPWRGRCEIKQDAGFSWFLDCAHTQESLRVATQWFAGAAQGRCTVVFNQQIRANATGLLDVIHAEAARRGITFERAFFCTSITYATGFKRDLVNNRVDPEELRAMTVQRNFAAHWKAISPETTVEVVPCIEEVVTNIRTLDTDSVFVTGGVHIVGGFLSVLEGADAL